MNALAALVCTLAMTACLIQPRGGGNYGGGGGAPASSSGDPSGDPAGEPMPAAYPPGSSSTSSAPAPSGPVSVTIRSACSKTVKVFYGDKPKFGSGTYSSISSNSVQSHSFRQGDMFWIVDDSENGLGSTSIGPSTRELEISSSCTSIQTR